MTNKNKGDVLKIGKSLLIVYFFLLSLNTFPVDFKIPSFKNADIKIDGKLDETEWQKAYTIPDLTQQQPVPGGKTPYKTTVKIFCDNKNLYFAFICYQPKNTIAIHTMLRDGEMHGDDYVYIILDTFGDGKTGFMFQVNAAGARRDGLISNPEDISPDWDGIWNARTKIYNDKWVAEIKIPAITLQFRKTHPFFKIEFCRYVAKDLTTFRWIGTTLDSQPYDVKLTAKMEGVDSLSMGKGISFSPYAITKVEKTYGNNQNSTIKSEAGFDLRWNITPGIFAMLTVNTDFAETEVDTRQINLTRFPLFFPEKREFFLEGSNLFEFGIGLYGDFKAFYSRRIGLYHGKEVPIDYGVKVLGRQGKTSIAALYVKTRDSGNLKGTDFLVSRVAYDISDKLKVSALITDGNPDGVSDNTFTGVDLIWRTSDFMQKKKNFIIGGWWGNSSGDIEGHDRDGYGFKIDYPNDLIDANVSFKKFGKNLNPALGFLPRPGTKHWRGGIAIQPRPKGWLGNYVRQFFFEFYGSQVRNLKGHIESWRIFTAPINLVTPKGYHFEFNYAPQYEFLPENFEIAEGVVIPAGGYRFNRERIEINSPRSRSLQAGGQVWFGDFYDGRLNQWETYIAWSSKDGSLKLQIEAENDYGYLPEGNFIERLWQVKVVYAFNPDFIISSYTQYNYSTGEIGMNNRIRYTIEPGKDIFFVWNYNWKRFDGESLFNSQLTANQIAIKIRWTWRK